MRRIAFAVFAGMALGAVSAFAACPDPVDFRGFYLGISFTFGSIFFVGLARRRRTSRSS